MGSALMVSQAPLLSKEDKQEKEMMMARWLNHPLAVLTSSDKSTAPSMWACPFTVPAVSHSDHAGAPRPSLLVFKHAQQFLPWDLCPCLCLKHSSRALPLGTFLTHPTLPRESSALPLQPQLYLNAGRAGKENRCLPQKPSDGLGPRLWLSRELC